MINDDRDAEAELPRMILVGVGSLCAISVLTAILSSTSSRSCIFPDGESYCEMARGRYGAVPFSRRPLVPWIVRFLGHVTSRSLGDRFWMVTMAGVVVLCCSIYCLAAVVARNLGMSTAANRRAAVCSVMLWLAVPYPLRALMVAPVLPDVVATALTVGWLALIVGGRSTLMRTFGTALVIAAALSREASVPVVLVASVTAVATGFRRPRDIAPSVGAAFMGLVIAFMQPSVSFAERFPYHWNYKGSMNEIIANINAWAGDIVAVPRAVIVGSGVGIVALSPASWRVIRSTFGNRRYKNSGLTAVGAAGSTALGLALVGGRDLGRLSSASAPFWCVMLAIYFSTLRTTASRVAMVLCAGGLLFACGSLSNATLDERGYAQFAWGTRLSAAAIVSAILFAVALAALPSLFGRRSQTRLG